MLEDLLQAVLEGADEDPMDPMDLLGGALGEGGEGVCRVWTPDCNNCTGLIRNAYVDGTI